MFDELQQFREGYITECLELLADMEVNLMGLSETNASREEMDAIFRCAHSIKGGAGAFGLSAIAQFTHVLEALLDKLREGEITSSRAIIDTLLSARDIVLRMVNYARDGSSLPADFGSDIAARLQSFCDCAAGHAPAPVAAPAAACALTHYTIRFAPHRNLFLHGNEPLLLLRELATLGTCITTADLSALPALEQLDAEQCYLSWSVSLTTDVGEPRIREVFEFVEDECELTITANVVEAAAQAPQPLLAATASPAAAAAQSPASSAVTSIRVDIDKVDTLINMVGEMVIIQAMLAMQTRSLHPQEHAGMLAGIAELTSHTRDLQEAVMAVRMQPVKSIFSRMPRLVRDLSSQLGKDIRLQTSGESTEVDKTIIEQLSDPLTHMIRNALDHGLETPQERLAAGKQAQGTIHLSAFHRGGRIIIELRDDGRGINRARVLHKAQEKGLVAANAQLSDTEIDHLIFAPGFSTAEQVTSISGRGVGMDVVRRNIESIGGTVSLRNMPGEGTLFSISLPLTLAILDGMIVRVAAEFYIIPIASILETLCPKPTDMRDIADGQCVINVRGSFIPVMHLSRLFNVPACAGDEACKPLVVLVENGEEQMGLVVHELVGQQQVVIKTLEDNSDPVAGISGATILGDGKVSLIIDIAGLHLLNHPPSANLKAA